ncbi:SNF2 family N-terminal domain-containing protein [Hypoxylon sp. FL1284]|nr:SNF2 family N-terminal domain-containing protein [Hypoxylon sp. FL1284]
MADNPELKWLATHIPAGCLKVQFTGDTKLLFIPPTPLDRYEWKFFSSPRHTFPEELSLPAHAQDAVLQSSDLQPFVCLWNRRWVQMSFNQVVDSDGVGYIRVYILPHDVNRTFLNPTSELTRATSLLMSRLEKSWRCWNEGIRDSPVDSTPDRKEDPFAGVGTLLSMFNTVPSPDPKPELEANLDTRDGMQCLLESRIPGLTTTLYPYQGRSAALMFQREENPGMVVDPRFRTALDQEGKPWYFDDVSGEILREPKYYDAVRGGILAEEMGTGKTLICLALILCTQHEPTKAPEPFAAEVAPRKGTASLVDVAAATANKHAIPWRPYFDRYTNLEYKNCMRALSSEQNLAYYNATEPSVQLRKSRRVKPRPSLVKVTQVFLSSVSLIVVPNNLVKQWQTEIQKHTTGLNVLVLEKNAEIPPMKEVLKYDIILCSASRLDEIEKERRAKRDFDCVLEHIRFKRCIVDEGHTLGNKGKSWHSSMVSVLDRFEIAARWVVTGTPSRGLYGVDQQAPVANGTPTEGDQIMKGSIMAQERDDLQRIGNITSKYLKVRPWANLKNEIGDKAADWNVYVMHMLQHKYGRNRKDCVKNTLDSLMVRHRRSDISTLLPKVEEKIVVLDGSYQDKLSLNLFSMMIIFNSVQSQRQDVDYFFHIKQRQNLLQLVRNLRQACFFGGVFYSVDDITTALETAEGFLGKGEIAISAEDRDLLEQAISFGKLAVTNKLKDTSNKFHSMPLYLDGFPGGGGKSWSLDDKEADGQPICTDSGMIYALQRFLSPCIDAPTSLQSIMESGRLDQQGEAERSQASVSAAKESGRAMTRVTEAQNLAGNTPLGHDYHSSRPKSGELPGQGSELPAMEGQVMKGLEIHGQIAKPLEATKIISTVSAKLSYLIDSIVKYQSQEQIIVFYDNDNVAYYLAGVLEVLQIEHLIYSKTGLTAARRAQYVATFTHNPRFRVMLMDISHAAFGLDMRSASRIYFISPVLNPQIEAQAIGRARRISQKKPVSVETLVLRDSIEEVIVNRRKEMTHAEHSRIRSVLDDRPLYQWILKAKIIPMPLKEEGITQTAMLETPQFVFGRGFRRELHPDEGLITGSPEAKDQTNKAAPSNGAVRTPFKLVSGVKHTRNPGPAAGGNTDDHDERPPKRRARVTFAV